MSKLATEQNDPYSSSELQDSIENINKRFNEKYKNDLGRINNDLGRKLEDIDKILKTM